MKRNVTKKAKKQIDELVDRLKKNEILNSPAIQNLVEKAQKIAPLPQVHIMSGQADESGEKTPARSRTRRKSKVSSQQLLDLIATNEVANRIAERVLAQATDISNKVRANVKANVKEIKKVARATQKRVERVTGVTRTKAATKTKKTAAKTPKKKGTRKS